MFYTALHLAGWLDVLLTIITVATLIETGRRTLWVWLKGLYRFFVTLDRTARTLGDVAEGWPALKRSVDQQAEELRALQSQLHGRVLCPLTSTIPDPQAVTVKVETAKPEGARGTIEA